MEQFYDISHIEKKGTPYASAILSNSGTYLSTCHKCKSIKVNRSNKDLILVIEGKGELPDYLLCGQYPLFIISNKTLKMWQKYSVTGYDAFPIAGLINKDGEEIITDIRYFDIHITGRVKFDFNKMNVKIKYRCQKCGAVEYNKQVWQFGLAYVKQGSYDESDLFVAEYFETAPLCTEKILDIVYKENLTNFKFRTFESQFMFLNRPPAIDLQKHFRD